MLACTLPNTDSMHAYGPIRCLCRRCTAKLHQLGYPTVPFLRLRASKGGEGLEVDESHAPRPPDEEVLDEIAALEGQDASEAKQGGSSPEGSPSAADDPTVGTQGSSSLAAQRTDQVRLVWSVQTVACIIVAAP